MNQQNEIKFEIFVKIPFSTIGTLKIEIDTEKDSWEDVKRKIGDQGIQILEHHRILTHDGKMRNDAKVKDKKNPIIKFDTVYLFEDKESVTHKDLNSLVINAVNNVDNKLSGNKIEILALDVENTIITGYDYEKTNENGRFLAIIDPSLLNILEQFHSLGFKIVIVTGTDGDDIEYYHEQFSFNQYIDRYSPENHEKNDSKCRKLKKYSDDYDALPENFYFFDDGPGVVEEAKNAGFNSFLVTKQITLVDHLKILLETIQENKKPQRINEKLRNDSFFKPSSRIENITEQPEENSNTVYNSNRSLILKKDANWLINFNNKKMWVKIGLETCWRDIKEQIHIKKGFPIDLQTIILAGIAVNDDNAKVVDWPYELPDEAFHLILKSLFYESLKEESLTNKSFSITNS